LFEAADAATADLFEAFLQMQEGDETAVDQLFDEWLFLEEGCSFDDDFCGNTEWVAVARRDPSGTYLPGWVLCSAQLGAARTMWIWVIGALVAAVLAFRRATGR
jgi:hypothetical protein